MYLGNKTTKISTACYHAVFCIRRLCIVMTYVAFRTNQNGYGYFAMTLLFLVIQSAYILYIFVYLPHTDNVYNYLEIVCEIGLILLAYMGLIFSRSFELSSA